MQRKADDTLAAGLDGIEASDRAISATDRRHREDVVATFRFVWQPHQRNSRSAI
jgi:hypothetical protein